MAHSLSKNYEKISKMKTKKPTIDFRVFLGYNKTNIVTTTLTPKNHKPHDAASALSIITRLISEKEKIIFNHNSIKVLKINITMNLKKGFVMIFF